MTAIALTIAGSDSGGGAGIQADLKTFAFHRVHGTSALTCVTAQNTLGVERVESLSPEMVTAQIDAVVRDFGVSAVKTGMLFSSEIIEAVAEAIERWRLISLVVDPVMVSRVGAKLIDDRAVDSLFDSLIPLASIVTPNRYEAQLLSGIEINDFETMKAAAEIIFQKSATPVLVKGGGMKGRLRGVDICFDGQEWETFKTRNVETDNTHGTGCTLSAAIAANLALGDDLKIAVKKAKDYITNALEHSLAIGQGTGPVGHFYRLKALN
ncbi:bifunctional hydroxymethylpyrimidine kinase/phosphomethylpyrimidine kinase [Microcystis aeruginosa CS-564/01]|uniref:bifunctional hydroxymethylpyrimidine kinase/phosphomethylpyrimidine kinase n=1 Tax=Microcystis aeruginosa TaxID=1126 RepID=UPI00232D1EEE|nr:bifunctional hydroxymethylpyrimidine kinase/phosphomethylpyrimidine kinase [Microcystis aeruginosa]MDB9425851.1 bifunctional hydroxymethylpyrimidine kinase/phosphomethylpyrimidine kinase [Microcystis aeruginosa CS-564/01]